MISISVPTKATEMNPEDLRRLVGSDREADYVLIDVRQPEEYRAGHLPGAVLLPLAEFEDRLEEVWRRRDRAVVFYCHGGSRSRLAARLAADGLGLDRSYSLRGGLNAWRGSALTGLPPLRLIEPQAGLPEILTRAIDLEKGVRQLYAALIPHFVGRELDTTLRELEAAEIAHGQALHEALTSSSRKPVPPFEMLFDSLPGNLLESGESWGSLVLRFQQVGRDGCVALLELALELEYRAHDLYKNLAERAESPESRQLLLELAQQEKLHAVSLLHRVGLYATASQ